MSIQSEITRISGNVSDALTAIAQKGVTVPSGSNSDDLATLIAQISGGGTGAISVVDTTDTHGGTVRTITALDISDTTAVAADVAQGKYFYTAAGVKTAGTGSGGTPSATQHTIYFEFSDETDTTITAYYDSTFISDAITATEPTTYGSKTVDSASLDGVAWYTRPTETWETVWQGQSNTVAEDPYPYFWISAMSSVTIVEGEMWRITIDNDEYTATAQDTGGSYGVVVGNPKYIDGQDDGTNVPFCWYNVGWGAWVGSVTLSPNTTYNLKFERRTS